MVEIEKLGLILVMAILTTTAISYTRCPYIRSIAKFQLNWYVVYLKFKRTPLPPDWLKTLYAGLFSIRTCEGHTSLSAIKVNLQIYLSDLVVIKKLSVDLSNLKQASSAEFSVLSCHNNNNNNKFYSRVRIFSLQANHRTLTTGCNIYLQ